MAFGVLALCERGVLNLDEDLSVYLGYPVRNPHFKDVPVTLRMLLTHTAAIRAEGNYGTRGMQKGCTPRELLENAENWLNVKPGEAFLYSNLGAGAAGVVMERAAEKPLDDIMQESRLFPAGDPRQAVDPRRISPRSDLANGYSMRFPLPLLKYNAQALAKRKPEPFDPERDHLCAARPADYGQPRHGRAAGAAGLPWRNGRALRPIARSHARPAGRAGRRRPNRPRAEHCGPARRVSRLVPRRPSGRGLRHVRRIVR